MLPEISLDTVGFEDIVKKARSQIAELYPAWTDYNAHDPGITLLELFAFLKEAQQFYIDQTSDKMRKKFLQLMGVTPLCRQAAQTVVGFKSDQALHIPMGLKFWINGLCFEPLQMEHIPAAKIKALVVRPKEGPVFQSKFGQTNQPGRTVVYPFGKKTGVGSQFLLCLTESLEAKKTYRLSFALDDPYDVKRNPVEHVADFVPLSQVKVSYFDGREEVTIDVEDDTLGFLRDGAMVFSIPRPMERTKEENMEGYFLRFTLQKDEFDVSPALTNLCFDEIPLIQKDTKAIFLDVKEASFWEQENAQKDYYRWDEATDCYWDSTAQQAAKVALYEPDFYHQRTLAQGNGLPNQCYEIKQKGLLADSFTLLVSSMKYEGAFRQWIAVKDFDASGPDDCHYVVDEERNCILFGNGIQGRMPEAEIRIVSCGFSAGSDGNIKHGQIMELPPQLSNTEGSQRKDAWGGREKETLEEAFVRARKAMAQEERAISAADYEHLVMETPGLRIWDCKVLDGQGFYDQPGANEVRMVVWPYSESGYGQLSESYQKNIYGRLLPRRLLGTKVRLYSPIYIEVDVHTQLRIKPQYLQAEERVEQAVRAFFATLKGFGPTISYSALFACIDALEEVVEIYMLYVDARGGRISRDKNGDVLLPPLGVLLLKKVDCIVIR